MSGSKGSIDHPSMLAFGMSEAEVIEGAKQGDGGCFEYLYVIHKRRVYSLCLRMTGNTAKAEDLTQEAFLQLYRKVATFRGHSSFSTWLHRLVVNIVQMHLRKKGLPEVPLDETLDSTEEDAQKKEFGSPDQALAGVVDRLHLQRAIESLPSGYRVVVTLHDIEGYRYDEIAAMTGFSIGNIKSQLNDAHSKLRGLLRTSYAERDHLFRRGRGDIVPWHS